MNSFPIMVIIALFCACSSLGAQDMTITNSLEKYGVHAYSKVSPQFSGMVSPILNQVAGSELNIVMPHSVVLENGSGRNIWSVTVVYTFPNDISASGQAKRYVTTQVAPIRTTQDRMLMPGDQLLVTPLRGITIMRRPSDTSMRERAVPLSVKMQAADYKRDTIDTGKKVEVLVDSVIFDDGELIGPDTAGKMAVFNDRLEADRHLMDAAAGLHGQPLKEFLQTTSAKQVSTDRDVYTTSIAGNLLAMLNAQGEEALLAMMGHIRAINPFQGNTIIRRAQQ